MWPSFALAAALLAGCGNSGTRRDLDGSRFVSLERLPGGHGAPGDDTSFHWSLAFEDGSYTWDLLDVRESGRYELAGDGTVTAFGATGDQIEGFFDASSGRLRWAGAWYRPDGQR